MAAIAGPRKAPVVPWSQRGENQRKVRPNSNNECGDSNHAGAERCQSPLRADRIQQFAAGHEGKQTSETARSQDEADVLLRPFLLGQIDGYIGTETSQHGSVEKIDSVKAVQARTRWRGTSGVRQCRNRYHKMSLMLEARISGQS